MSDEHSQTGSVVVASHVGGRQMPDSAGAEVRTTQRNYVALSLAGFFSAVRSEMITPLRMIFLVTALQAPLPVAALIEGVANGVGGLARVAARRLARRSGPPKVRTMLGYGISNAVTPLLAVVSTWPSALALTLFDAMGQGIRRDPLSELTDDSSPPPGWARGMGVIVYSQMIGAALGALVGALLLLLVINDLQLVFALAAIPGMVAVLVMLLVREHPGRVEKRTVASPPRLSRTPVPLTKRKLKLRYSVAPLGVRFWMFLGISTVFALGNVSAGFFLLRLAGLEQSLGIVMLAYFGHRLVAALLTSPLARLQERWGAIPVLITGYAGLGLLYAAWVFASQTWLAWTLLLAYGAYVALSLGANESIIADLVPPPVREVATDWFSVVTGVAVVAANVIAGWFWIIGGPSATFTYGASAVALAVALVVAWMPWLRRGYPEL